MSKSSSGSTPRPGLRKAGDADLHPSTPAPVTGEPSFLRRGLNTSDSVGPPDRDKLVDLGVKVPKSLRKAVRDEAKRRGMKPDEVVGEALRDRMAR
jgi:hypothetical protein